MAVGKFTSMNIQIVVNDKVVRVVEITAQDEIRVELQQDILRYKLSPRELDVVRLSVHGWRVKEIATKLELAEPTVNVYVKGILRKLKARNMANAVYKLMTEGGI